MHKYIHRYTHKHTQAQELAQVDMNAVALRQWLGIVYQQHLRAASLTHAWPQWMEEALADSRGSTLNKVAKALTLAGIEFVTRDDGAIGVILKAQNPPDETHWVAFALDRFGW